MPATIQLDRATLDFRVYSVRAKSLRGAIANATVGGRLFRTQGDRAVVRALDNISFTLEHGDRLALVGHNGSGKSSLLRMLAGIYEPTEGRIRMSGRVSSMLSMSIGLDPEASGIQNIKNLALMQMFSPKEIRQRLPKIVEFSELGAYIHMPFKTYSAGMMARLTFAVATEMDADILLLDEWLAAGDLEFQKKASSRMAEFVDRAGVVVLATHNFDMAKSVCNKVLMLEAGRISFFGYTSEWNGKVPS